MEYAERGDLSKELARRRKARQKFSNAEVWQLVLQILNGLRFLHKQNIVHRDVKSLNVFITADHNYKLGDFGVSREVPAEKNVLMQSFYGTPLYLSPEIINGTGYTQSTDLWSFGVLLYEVLHEGRMPFSGPNLKSVTQSVLTGRYAPLENKRREFQHVLQQVVQSWYNTIASY